MAVPFVSQQVIRIVTEKVLEQIAARQQARTLPAVITTPAEPGGPVVGVDPSAFNQLVRYVDHLEGQLKTLTEKQTVLEEKFRRLEQRWGWQTMFRIVVAVFVAFVLGALVAYAAHLGGWY